MGNKRVDNKREGAREVCERGWVTRVAVRKGECVRSRAYMRCRLIKNDQAVRRSATCIEIVHRGQWRDHEGSEHDLLGDRG